MPVLGDRGGRSLIPGQVFLSKNFIMIVHELKTAQPFFNQILKGSKRFELRKNDRNFKIGDYLNLIEYPNTNNLKPVSVQIIDILENYPGIQKGYCILYISNPL